MEINTVRNWTAREQVATTDLKAGDIICEHGGLFALSNRRECFDGEAVVFDGIYLGPAFSDDECAIPAHWRTNEPRKADGSNHGYWQVQGNGFAMRCRVTDPRPMFYHGEQDGQHVWKHQPVQGVVPEWVERARKHAATPAEETMLQTFERLS